MGLSAGAHLAMLAHLAAGIPELPPGLPTELRDVAETVCALVLHYGPYDLARRRPFPDGFDPIGELLGERLADEAWVRLASPVHQAAHATAPMRLVHGSADADESYRESERTHEALESGGR